MEDRYSQMLGSGDSSGDSSCTFYADFCDAGGVETPSSGLSTELHTHVFDCGVDYERLRDGGLDHFALFHGTASQSFACIHMCLRGMCCANAGSCADRPAQMQMTGDMYV